MKLKMRITLLLAALAGSCVAQSTAGIQQLLQRRLPSHVDQFTFSLADSTRATSVVNITDAPNDEYSVSNGQDGKIQIAGNSPIALASGLRWYLTNYVHVDIFWFIGSTLQLAQKQLPKVNETYHGSSIVPLRYHFNTVTFSYTAAFWSWKDWELQLDWMALHGVNLPLAWVGYEKVLVEVFREYGYSEAAIATFLSGPAFQAWNRFGNIQGSWGGDLPMSWINSQSDLQKQIVKRMVDLGMTPVLPSFTGFVPRQISTIAPKSSFVNGSQWNYFPPEYTNVTFLEPFDPLYGKMQKSFIKKQKALYGDVTNIYTLDQYNENDPYSGNLAYLKNVTKNTIASLKNADPNAIWMLQGWLFYSSADFWTSERIEAYLGGVANSDMLILDLFSESAPQWQRTNSYYGKPWIWCELHDYGGNMGLYGQVENVTYNPVEALNNKTTTMVGMGLTMEGQEGNEVIYDILLDQAWSKTPIDSEEYFHDWVSSRYHAAPSLPEGVYKAWNVMRQTVYNNTNFTAALSVTKSIFELHPNVTIPTSLTHPNIITYNPATLVKAWKHFLGASEDDETLWKNEAYLFDLTDITRQVMANAFRPLYFDFLAASNSSLKSHSPAKAKKAGRKALALLEDLDAILQASGQAHFSLAAWIESARARAGSGERGCPGSKTAQYYEYNARNQITLWGPTGEISDYASKEWGGLISSYYVPRWRMFFEYTLNSTTSSTGENPALSAALLKFEEAWQTQACDDGLDDVSASGSGELEKTIKRVVKQWPDVFHG